MSLTDRQFSWVQRAAALLAPHERDRFLRSLANHVAKTAMVRCPTTRSVWRSRSSSKVTASRPDPSCSATSEVVMNELSPSIEVRADIAVGKQSWQERFEPFTREHLLHTSNRPSP